MRTWTARCNCGGLTAICEGEPARHSMCHCRACQRRTGSAFGLAAYFEEERVRIAGESQIFERRSDAGRWARSHFCPTCGTTLFWRLEFRPGLVGIATGTIEELDFPAPQVSVWTIFKRPWLTLPPLTCFDEQG